MNVGDTVWVKARVNLDNKDRTFDVNILDKYGERLETVFYVPIENIESDKPKARGKVTIEYDLDTGKSKVVGREEPSEIEIGDTVSINAEVTQKWNDGTCHLRVPVTDNANARLEFVPLSRVTK